MNKPFTKRIIRRRTLLGTSAAVLVGSGMIAGTALADSATATSDPDGPKPTVVLVHGAFTDAGSWRSVTGILQTAGYRVIAPPNPLRGLDTDAACLAEVVKNVDGPVIVAGHSYGGAVITNAVRGIDGVKALVYVAAFAPDEGETTGGIGDAYPETLLPQSLAPLPYPDGTVDLYIAPDRFGEVFVQDLPSVEAAVLASAQRPMAEAAVTDPSGVPAWRSLPSWFLIATRDHALHPDAQAAMAERAGAAQVVELAGGHGLPVTHPDEVADLIRTAARRTCSG